MELLSQYAFFTKAIIAGILISIICSLIGTFIVQRKMSFLGNGLAHSALGGVGLALLLNVEPLYVAIPFTIVINLLINLIKEKTSITADTSIGIMFATATALGIIFLNFKEGYVGDGYSYLFGSILAVNSTDIIITLITTIITLIFISRTWTKLSYLTFAQELAKADKINNKKIENTLSIIISITIVISIKIIGIMLISAMMILPAAIAKLYAKTFAQMTILAIIAGTITTICGLFLSLIINLPSGATIILFQTIILVISIIITKKK